MKEQLIYFKEILTGVQTDSTAKIIRALCFLVLAGGTAWSIMSYIDASRFSDTSIEMNIPSRAMTSNPQELDSVVTLAQNVNNMRTGGERLASQMDVMGKKLFNTKAMAIFGIETETEETEEEAVPQPPALIVRAVMRTGQNATAVISLGSSRKYRGLIVRKGYKLPEDSGTVTSIKPDGITINFNDEELYYKIESDDKGSDSYINIRTTNGRPII